ncbi:YciI family protein [Kribbella sp. CA-253562]|uniref:YciI family protein n=1 Tax=Kribbella sp. CA-253562 TaxID=3239942 RepID=UPI003D8B0A6C
MEYFVYGRDRSDSFGLKQRLTEEHWAFMDGYAEQLIARGPTMNDDDSATTGSLHIVDLPGLAAAETFAYDEPYYQAGVFESVLLHRFRNLLGRTMWDFTGPYDGTDRFLLIGLGEPTPEPASPEHLIVYGELLDDETPIGWVAAVDAPDRETAARLTGASSTTEIRPWRFGGRR